MQIGFPPPMVPETDFHSRHLHRYGGPKYFFWKILRDVADEKILWPSQQFAHPGRSMEIRVSPRFLRQHIVQGASPSLIGGPINVKHKGAVKTMRLRVTIDDWKLKKLFDWSHLRLKKIIDWLLKVIIFICIQIYFLFFFAFSFFGLILPKKHSFDKKKISKTLLTPKNDRFKNFLRKFFLLLSSFFW